MNEPKISVLIPVYNVENYLRECLDSIVAQTFHDFEVICVDDGSTDKSLEILQEYKNKDRRFTIIKQDHKGVGPARNLTLSLAKSKYVQFLDSDDFIEPNMFEKSITPQLNTTRIWLYALPLNELRKEIL